MCKHVGLKINNENHINIKYTRDACNRYYHIICARPTDRQHRKIILPRNRMNVTFQRPPGSNLVSMVLTVVRSAPFSCPCAKGVLAVRHGGKEKCISCSRSGYESKKTKGTFNIIEQSLSLQSLCTSGFVLAPPVLSTWHSAESDVKQPCLLFSPFAFFSLRSNK